MMYKNLTVRELFASMPLTKDIVEFFDKGLRSNNDRLAGAAAEELIRRGETDLIVRSLDKFYAEEDYQMHQATLFAVMVDLAESCRGEDVLLGMYAHCGISPYGPTEWIKENSERLKKLHRSGAIRSAKPWAKKYVRPAVMAI